MLEIRSGYRRICESMLLPNFVARDPPLCNHSFLRARDRCAKHGDFRFAACWMFEEVILAPAVSLAFDTAGCACGCACG